MRFPFFAQTVVAGVLCLSAISSFAQDGAFKISAPTTIARPGGARLEGDKNNPARVQAPQLDVEAGVIAFDYNDDKQITEVRALTQAGHRVQIKVELSSKTGGAATHIEATADKATLNPPTRTLVLSGNVDGFYQLAQGLKTTLRGETVTAKYEGENLLVNVDGADQGVRFEVPPEAIGQPGAFGAVVFTAKRASFDQGGGAARLSGDARALSTEGANKFDIRADEFVLTRTAENGGTIDKLVTIGRTQLKMDLPPESAQSTPAATVKEGDKKTAIGRPSHIEAAADSMTIVRPSNTLLFVGNVSGFYQLSSEGTGAATRYNFAGDRAEVRYAETTDGDIAAGLNVKVTGQPSTIELPGFNLGF